MEPVEQFREGEPAELVVPHYMPKGAKAVALSAFFAVGHLDSGKELVREIATADYLAFDFGYLAALFLLEVSELVPGLDFDAGDPVDVDCHLFQTPNDLEDELIGAALR